MLQPCAASEEGRGTDFPLTICKTAFAPLAPESEAWPVPFR